MMFLGGARQTGKTYKMVKWLEGDKYRSLLVHNKRYATQLKNSYPEVATQIFSFEEFRVLKKGFWPRTREIAIDNIDIIIQQWFKAPVKYLTFTGGVDFTDAYLENIRRDYKEEEDPRRS